MSMLGRFFDDDDRKAVRLLARRARPTVGRIVGWSLSMLVLAATAGLAVRLFSLASGG